VICGTGDYEFAIDPRPSQARLFIGCLRPVDVLLTVVCLGRTIRKTPVVFDSIPPWLDFAITILTTTFRGIFGLVEYSSEDHCEPMRISRGPSSSSSSFIIIVAKLPQNLRISTAPGTFSPQGARSQAAE
jgi:hypothetical protein